MLIDKISTENNKIYNIHLETGKVISLVESVFVRFNLYKGKEITKEDIDEMRIESKVQQGIDLALKKLKNRKTEFEIRELLKESFDPDIIEQVVQYLYRYNFLNDKEYAILYARDKSNINRWGEIKIKFQLQQKGVPQEFISLALDEIQPMQYKLAKKTYEKRAFKYNLKEYKDRQKLKRYLYGRGFHPLVIEKLIKEVTHE